MEEYLNKLDKFYEYKFKSYNKDKPLVCPSCKSKMVVTEDNKGGNIILSVKCNSKKKCKE